jgi:hypothetical protein
MCGANTCPACLPHNARGIAMAVTLVRPEYLLTIGQLEDRWPLIKKRLNRFNLGLRRFAGPDLQHAYHVEPYGRGDRCHTHGWLHGRTLDADVVLEAAVSAGIGSDVMLEVAHPDRLCDYGLKLVRADPRILPGSDLWPEAQRFLEVNGGRLVHPTRGFWRDGATGERLEGKDHAIQMARAARGLGGVRKPVGRLAAA